MLKFKLHKGIGDYKPQLTKNIPPNAEGWSKIFLKSNRLKNTLIFEISKPNSKSGLSPLKYNNIIRVFRKNKNLYN
jgi:hypothetical protein